MARVVVDGTRACVLKTRAGRGMRRTRARTVVRASATVVGGEGFGARAARAGARGRRAVTRREDEAAVVVNARVPTSRVEEYRFTDFSELAKATFVGPKDGARCDASGTRVAGASARVVLVDGALDATQSDLADAVRSGVSVRVGEGDAATGAQSAARGNVFSAINSASASDVVVVRVAAGVKCAAPLHIVTLSTGGEDGAMRVSAPRVTIVLEEGAELSVVEDFTGEGETEYWQNGVCEITLAKGASLKHSLIQNHGRSATHTRTTLVTQEEESRYEVNEVSVGGKTARHDVNIKQLGPRTETVLGCFNLAGANQTLDLHSKVTLDHEEGVSNQLHKCIVSAATGRGVFDGNVQVNRLAQRTDAQQLSRNLLLVPKATVNVKPNLQIIADDVKCTHGCTVSDLEEEELFYIRSRGLSTDTARSLLVSGFGVEVISRFPGKDVRERVNAMVRSALLRDAVQFEWTGDA